MKTHEELTYQMKLEALRKALSPGAAQAAKGEFVERDMEGIIAKAKRKRHG